MKTYRTTVALADPNGEQETVAAGQLVTVERQTERIKQLVEGGYLVESDTAAPPLGEPGGAAATRTGAES